MYYGTRPSRNLIPFPYANPDGYTHQGITYAANADGSVTANGTAMGISRFVLKNRLPLLPNTAYTLSGNPNINGVRQYVDLYRNGKWEKLFANAQNPVTFITEEDCTYNAILTVAEGITVNNLTFYPMLNEGKTALPYERGSKNYPQRVKAIKRKLTTKTVTVRNPKNLIPFPYRTSAVSLGGLSSSDNEDGSITIIGKRNVGGVAFERVLTTSSFQLEIGKTYTYTLYATNYPKILRGAVQIYKIGGGWVKNIGYSENGKPFTFTFTDNVLSDGQYIRFNVYGDFSTKVEINTTAYPILNEGPTAEPYFVEQDIPYYVPVLCDVELPIDTQTNLIPFPYRSGDFSYNGIMAKMNVDGSVRLFGTATARTTYVFCDLTPDILSAGTYYVSINGTSIRLNVECYQDGKYVKSFNPGNRKHLIDWNGYNSIKIYYNIAKGATLDETICPKLNRGDKPTLWYPRNEEVN